MSTIPDVFPRGVRDPLCPDEHVIADSTDRRLLWHLEGELAIGGTTEQQRDLGRALSQYLHATCEHHWHEHLACCETPDECPPPHRQCLWCNYVQWHAGDPASPWSDELGTEEGQ